MITHTLAFENLAKAPVKQTNVIVARQLLGETDYTDDTPIWTSSDSLMQVKIDAVGEMLGTATKKATVTLIGIIDNIVVKDIYQIRLGIYNADPSVSGYTYISEGFFIVDTIDYNYDAGSTVVTMYDHMWTAGHSLYTDTVVTGALEYPVTVQDMAEYVSTLLGLTLDAGFSSLPNSQFEITEDLYSGISGATMQNVIQDIAGATGTTARISDTTLTFSQYSVNSENLNSDSLKTLKIGDTYGPITSVVLGRVPQNDNIAVFSVAPFTDTITAVNTTTNLLTITAHAMADGNMVRVASTGTLPAPLQADTNYYVYTDGETDTFALAPTYNDAIAGTNLIDLTTAGTGTITIPSLTTREIQINNNQILDDNRQDLLPPLYNELSGIDWTDVKSDTIGLGWHEVGDVIQFTQGSKTVKAFLNEIHVTLAGSIKETLISTIPDVAAINYQTAGGILKTLYNTEIKVDKQAQEIVSVVSQQTEFEGETQENFTQLTQNVNDVTLTIQKAGGGNLLTNSVGFAKEQTTDADDVSYGKLVGWEYEPGYTVAGNGTITSYDSSDSQNNGGISGRVIQMSTDYLSDEYVTLKQRVNVAVGTPLSFGLRFNKLANKGWALISVENDNDFYYLYVDEVENYVWEEIVHENFVTTMPWLDVTVEASAENFMFTDLRLMYGTTMQNWVQSNSEILSANVQFTKDGMRIFDESHDTETQVTYNEFSTRRRSDGMVLFEADDSGVVTNDLKIRGSTSYERDGETIIKQITIPSSNPRGGIAFIRVS